MILEYTFERNHYDFEVTADDLYDYIDCRDNSEIAAIFTNVANGLSDEAKSTMREELGVKGARTIKSFVLQNRDAAISYFVSHCDLFKDFIQGAFKKLAKESYESEALIDLVF